MPNYHPDWLNDTIVVTWPDAIGFTADATWTFTSTMTMEERCPAVGYVENDPARPLFCGWHRGHDGLHVPITPELASNGIGIIGKEVIGG